MRCERQWRSKKDQESAAKMLKITRATNGEVIFTVSGRMDAEHLAELKTLLSSEANGCSIILDLRDLTLVDQDAVSFLGTAKPATSSSRIAQHTSASGSRENEAGVSRTSG